MVQDINQRGSISMTVTLIRGFRFLNTFIESSSSSRETVHIQSELEEAGLDIAPLRKLLCQV